MYTKCRFEVGDFMKGMFKAVAQCMAVSTNEICLHLGFTDHSISVSKKLK